MKIFVCHRSNVSKMTSRHEVTHVLSLLDHGKRPFLHPTTNKRTNWLLLHFEDNLLEEEPNSPTMWHVQRFLTWTKALPDDAILLVHCEAGVSRSTAAALAILVQFHGNDKIEECVKLLLGVRDVACPNSLITKFADDILGCNGELFAAAEEIVRQKLIR